MVTKIKYTYIEAALGFRRFVLRRFTITIVSETKNVKGTKIFKNPNDKYGIHVKKQRSQSEMNAIPIYHLSQSGMKFIKIVI